MRAREPFPAVRRDVFDEGEDALGSLRCGSMRRNVMGLHIDDELIATQRLIGGIPVRGRLRGYAIETAAPFVVDSAQRRRGAETARRIVSLRCPYLAAGPRALFSGSVDGPQVSKAVGHGSVLIVAARLQHDG